MYNDSPIKYNRQDKLNRKKFADAISSSILSIPKGRGSIVIGLMGGWGTGKSSLLNMVEKSIRYDVNVVRFNPWNYYSQQTLFASFFDELTNTLSLSNQIKTKFHKYKNKIYATGISLGSSVVPQVGALANLISDSEPNTLNEIKQDLDDIFKKQRKTVVIIDDIDRLNPDEVKQIFQLVKSLADFPNVIYILAFDKNYVNYALKEWNMDENNYSHSEEFIDKIIQVPLTIPKFVGDDLFNIFKDKLYKLLNNHNLDKKDFNIQKLYLRLYPFFKNIRDINRFCNALDFYLYSIGNEIWIYDFALVTALQIFEKDIYDEIKDNKDLLTGDLQVFEGNNDLFEIFNGNLKGFLDALFKNNKFKHEIAIKRILADLFPKVNYVLNSSHTPSSEISIKKEHCGIMENEYFDLYFTFDNTNSLSKSRIDSLIFAANNDINKLRSNLLLIEEKGLLASLINQLPNHFESFKEIGVKNLIKAFIEDYDNLFTDEPFNSFDSIFSKAINLIYYLLKEQRITEESFFEVISDCENNFFKTYLIWELDNVHLLNDESMSKVKEGISKYLSEYFEKTEFSKIEHVRSNIMFWKDFSGFENTNEYIINLKDEDLISFISEFKEKDTFEDKDEIRYDYLEKIVDLNSLKKRFDEIKNSNKDFDDEK